MNPRGYILLSGALGVAGQIILKRAMAALGPIALTPEALPGAVLGLALNPFVSLGLLVYLSGTFLWLIALSRCDLSYAYPFASLNYVLVLASAWWLLGEQPSPARITGVIAICCGVWSISRSPASTAGQNSMPVVAPAAPGGGER